MSEFIDVEVDEGDGIDEPVALRFKQVSPPVPARRVLLADARGPRWWRMEAPDSTASVALVEDSSYGQARLLFGGLRGLTLTDEQTGQARREPYLLLAHDTPVE